MGSGYQTLRPTSSFWKADVCRGIEVTVFWPRWRLASHALTRDSHSRLSCSAAVSIEARQPIRIVLQDARTSRTRLALHPTPAQRPEDRVIVLTALAIFASPLERLRRTTLALSRRRVLRRTSRTTLSRRRHTIDAKMPCTAKKETKCSQNGYGRNLHDPHSFSRVPSLPGQRDTDLDDKSWSPDRGTHSWKEDVSPRLRDFSHAGVAHPFHTNPGKAPHHPHLQTSSGHIGPTKPAHLNKMRGKMAGDAEAEQNRKGSHSSYMNRKLQGPGTPRYEQLV